MTLASYLCDKLISSINDVQCGNEAVSKFSSEIVYWGADCQSNPKP